MKKVISVLLSVIISLSSAVCAAAYDGEKNTPFILVAGMNVMPLYENDNQVWPMKRDTVVSLAKQLVYPISELIKTKNYKAFGDKALPVVYSAVSKLECDENGDSVYNITAPAYDKNMSNYPELYKDENKDELGIVRAACEKYGAENVYFYNYDWRLDPLEHADGLNTMIETALKKHNASRVTLACCSMGGTVVTSYLYKYGAKNVKNILMLSTAFQGVEAVGAMLSGELYIDKDALMNRVGDLGKTDICSLFYNILMIAADTAGLGDRVEDICTDILNNLKDEIYSEILKKVFGTMPGIFDLTAFEKYENAKSFMLDSNVNAKMISRCDEYIYCVQSKAKDLLEGAIDDGANVYIVCQYNLQGLPVYSHVSSNTDLLIDVKYASGGAVSSELDSVLPDDYVQAVGDGHDHISKDRMIDASSCMFPEYTFFIKNQAHVDYNVGDTTDFIFYLADSDKQLSVFDSDYTQFMYYNANKNTLTPLNKNSSKSFKNAIINILKKLAEIFKTIVSIFMDSFLK